jgi:hypothetical protein
LKRLISALLVVLVASIAGISNRAPATEAAPGDGLTQVARPAGCTGIGVAFDGTDILYTCANEAAVRKTDLAGNDNGTLSTADAGGSPVSVDAIAWDPNEGVLWGGDLDGAGSCRIWSIDMSSGLATLRFSFADPHGGCGVLFFDGLTVDTVTDTLWLSPDIHTFIHHYQKDGTEIAADLVDFAALTPAGEPDVNSGLAIGLDGNLFAGTNGFGKIVQIDPVTPAFLGVFSTVTGRDEDLECGPEFTKGDGSVVETILSADLNENKLDVLEAPAGTCISTAGPSISPPLVEEVIFPGGSVDIEKTVQTPVIPPTPDVFFLFDTTGSMGGDIATVQAKLADIIAAVGAQSVNPQYGVAKYEDFPFSPWGLESNVAYELLQAMTSNTTAVTTAINSLSTFPGSGGDTPESGYEGLYQALTGAGHDLPNPDGSAPDGDFADPGEIAPGQDAGFRPEASKVIMLVGDAAFHLPGDPPTSLQFAAGYPGAGQADVLAAQGDVTFFCLIPAELEGVGPEAQCDALGATSFNIGTSSRDIVAAIIAALGEVEIEVSMQSDCTDPISVTFDPSSQTVVSGSTAAFTETISVASDAPGGTYECDDWALIDGQPMTNAAGNIILEHKVIHVPEGFLTGGGQIDDGRGRNAKSISFGGNVGFLADFSLVGQWETNFHNVSVDSLDKARFHSTAITSLQFFNDGGAGPNPPPANANVALFTATGRLNGEDGWTLNVCLADRGEPGRQNDSIRVRLINPGGVVMYDSRGSTDFVSEDPGGQGGVCDSRHKLDAGNLQIHSGVKGP